MADYSFDSSLLSNGYSDGSSSVDTIESLSPGTYILPVFSPELQQWPKDSNRRCRVVRLNAAHVIYGCCECEDSFVAPRILERHLRDTHPWLRSCSVCPDCGRRFLHIGHMKRHRRECHQFGEEGADEEQHRQHECVLCGTRFKRAEHLRVHERAIHARSRDFVCELCGRTFARREHAVRHARLVHRPEHELRCEHCGKVFARLASLTRHRKCCIESARKRELPTPPPPQELQLIDPTALVLDCEEDDWIRLLLPK